jgi:translocation and assembly module TamB
MFRRILKWVLWIIGLLLAMMLLLAAGVFFTPKMVSTDWFRQQVESRASKTLHRAITVQDLRWTWKEGIRIKGLAAADDPEYAEGPLFSVDELLIFVDFKLGSRRLLVDLKADGLKGNLVREKDGRTNLEAWLSQLNPPVEPTEPARQGQREKKSAALPLLPGDLAARIKLTNAQLRLEDRMENRLLEIRDGIFTLNMPSLLSKPVDLNVRSQQSLDGKVLPLLDLAVHVEELVNEAGALDLQAAHAQINTDLPGLHMTLQGSLVQNGLEGEVKIDLAPLTEAVGPFMPAVIPKLSGEILFQTNAQLQTDKMILFDLNLTCKNILAGGGALKEKKIGPFSFVLSQKGTAEPYSRTVNLEQGEIHFMEKSGFSFKGRAKIKENNQVNLKLALSKVALNLDEIQDLAKGFMPHSIGWKGMDNAQTPDFQIKEAQLAGTLPNGMATLSIQDMALNLAKLHLELSKDSLNVEDLTLLVPHTTVQLKNRFPQDLQLQMSLGAKNIRIPGKQPVHLDECRISSVKVNIQDLSSSPEALWGMAGRITLEESGVFNGVRLSPQNDGTNHLSHGFKARIDLPQAPEARVILAQADLSTGPLKMSAFLPHPLKEGLTLKGYVKDALITQRNPFKLDVGEISADIRSGDVLEIHAQGEALDSGMTSFQTKGFMAVDLEKALKLATAPLQSKGELAGRMETAWQLQGRRPTEKEIAGLTDNTQSLEKRMRHAGFLENLALETKLINVAITLPLASGETLSAQGINSENPVSVSTTNGLESIAVLGRLTVDKIKRLPSLGTLQNPLTADVSLNAVMRNVNSLELKESLQLSPLAVKQTLEMSLNKLNRLLRRKEKPDLPALLKMLEARINADININTGPKLAPFTRGLTVDGPLNGHLALKLEGGKSVSLATRLESEGLNAALPPKMTISDLKTHFQWKKTYNLAFGPLKPESQKPMKALSLSVLAPEGPTLPKSFATKPLSQRLVEDLRGRFTKKPTLSFREAQINGGLFPIQFKNAEVQMRFIHSLPSIDYFQMDTMGGTLLGALRILEYQDRYRLQMNGAFSGLDTNRLLQSGKTKNSQNQKDMDEDTQVSGRMSLQVPMTANAGNVMGNLDAVFRLTHIGARTLERLLYAMDPHENNESIVGQRALLQKGTPRWIEVAVKNGNLSLTGEVSVGGTGINLPPIKRLNMASLPIQKQLQTLAGRLVPLLKGLKILSAKTLLVDQDGTIHFTEDGK